jgi:hypothetical protein
MDYEQENCVKFFGKWADNYLKKEVKPDDLYS